MASIEQADQHSKPEYLMARRLRCAKCGHTCIGITRGRKPLYYHCNGAQRKPKLCDMPYFRMNQVDDVIWEWINRMFFNLQNIAERLKGIQEDSILSNMALFDRIDIIERRIIVIEKQIEAIGFII